MAKNNDELDGMTPQGRTVDFKRLIFKHFFLILLSSAIGLGLSYFVYLQQKPVYESGCNLLVQSEVKGQVIPFQNDSGQQREQIPHAQVMASQAVVKLAVSDNTLGVQKLPHLAAIQDPMNYILKRLNVRPSRQNIPGSSDGIYEISFRDIDPTSCEVILTAIVKSYQEFLGARHEKGTKEVTELISDAEKLLGIQLHELESRYRLFRLDVPLVITGDNTTNVHKTRMQDIEATRARVAISLSERKAEYQSLTDARKRGASKEAISLMIQSISERRSEESIKNPLSEVFPLVMEQQVLLETLGPDHPKVKTLEKKIEVTRGYFSDDLGEVGAGKSKQRKDFVTVYIDALSYEIANLQSKALELDELFEDEQSQSKAMLAYEFQDEQFRKDIARVDQLYKSVVKRLDEINLIQNYGGYRTAILLQPGPGVYVAPILYQILFIGGMIGAIVGIGLGYVVELNDQSFRTPAEISDHLQIPIIGHIPLMASLVDQKSPLDGSLMAHFKPKSEIAEAYRGIRTSLYFSARDARSKVIQVTSPSPGDWKSTLAANLSVSIAQSGKRVLLVDADFRRPVVHKLFGIDKSIGMSSVIGGNVELPDAIQPTVIENLWCLPCGPRPSNPSELLTTRRFEELLEVLREQYDFVIVDTPPLLVVTDPAIVAPRVDGTILTIRLHKRARDHSARSVELLETHGGTILGIVVNGCAKNAAYDYGYDNGYNRYDFYAYNYGGKYLDEMYYSSDTDDQERPKKRIGAGRRRNG